MPEAKPRQNSQQAGEQREDWIVDDLLQKKNPIIRTPRIFIMLASMGANIDNGIVPELQRQNKEQKRKIEALESKIQDPNNILIMNGYWYNILNGMVVLHTEKYH